MTAPRLGHANLGLGVGLRTVHYAHILQNQPEVDWFEVITENFMDSRGRPRHVLEQIAERYRVIMHGVSLSIGSTDPLDFEYLGKMKSLARAVKPAWISDHVCWTGVAGINTHDLLPLPLTESSLRHVVERVRVVQDFLERPFVLENPSSYVGFKGSTMPEWEFIARLAEESDCGLLLDVNNVYVSSVNHDFDAATFIRSLPAERIVQFHLAGHTNMGTHIIDTHDGHVVDPVWELYRIAHQLTGGVSTLLEWDANIPPFEVVHAEVLKAKQFMSGQLRPVGQPAQAGSPARPPIQPAAATAGMPQPLHHSMVEVGMSGGEHTPGAARTDLPLEIMQRWFQAVITHPDGVAAGEVSDAAKSVVGGGEMIEDLLTRSHSLDAADRLSVYADAYFSRLIECLGEVFPMMRKLLGAEVFDSFTFEYLQDSPSRSYTLHHLGRHFPDWLVKSRSQAESASEITRTEEGPDWPDLLVDLARFEWAIYDVFDGPGVEGQPTLCAEELARLAPEAWAHSHLRLTPDVQLLALRFPINDFYTALRQAGEDEQVPFPDAEPSWIALNRRHFVVQRHPLTHAAHELLTAIMNGCALDEAIEAAAAVWTGSDEELASALREWFDDWSAEDFFLPIEAVPEKADKQ